MYKLASRQPPGGRVQPGGTMDSRARGYPTCQGEPGERRVRLYCNMDTKYSPNIDTNICPTD
eukprot:7256651-Prymnesium_polylepis.1